MKDVYLGGLILWASRRSCSSMRRVFMLSMTRADDVIKFLGREVSLVRAYYVI